ncbi:hypothetical protein CBS147337_10014 [Penicillium roqueforti]|nr:hypothetical protein CBS147337_10014 [Penicillium roqueforti]
MRAPLVPEAHAEAQVNLSNFPESDEATVRRSISLAEGATSEIGNVGSVAGSSVTAASAAIETAISQAGGHLEKWAKDLKSEVPAYYSVGLLAYCQGQTDHDLTCSHPTVSFSFNLSNILNSVSTEIDDVVPGVSDKLLTGYRDGSRAIIWLYISGSIAAILTTGFGIRKAFRQGGSSLLIISCTVSLSSSSLQIT